MRNDKEPIQWIWEGVVPEDAVTLLSAPEKVGKTTLLSLLLDRRRMGGQLLGRPVRPGRTIVCSEERPQLWAARQPPHPLTHQEILARWPADAAVPHTDSLWRVLAKATASGALVRSGAATKAEAFRFAIQKLEGRINPERPDG